MQPDALTARLPTGSPAGCKTAATRPAERSSLHPRVLWQKLQSLAVERFLRIRTIGQVGAVSGGGVHYTPLPYQIVFRILETVHLGPGDVFVDIGSGKGRVVCCAARMPIKKVIALEINRKLLDESRENVRRLRGARAHVEFVGDFAENYDYRDATVIYMYNPFEEHILRKVLSRLNASFKARPRLVQIVYANCLYDHAIAELSWLKRFETWPSSKFAGFGCPISFWRSESCL